MNGVLSVLKRERRLLQHRESPHTDLANRPLDEQADAWREVLRRVRLDVDDLTALVQEGRQFRANSSRAGVQC